MTTANRMSAVTTSPAHRLAGNIHGQSEEHTHREGVFRGGLDFYSKYRPLLGNIVRECVLTE